MRTIHPSEISVAEMHHYLLGSVAPRPIGFASTVDKDGNRNLSPFSFFNVFSANPPILVFSPARSGRTGATKNTYDNVKEVAEVVINIVDYQMLNQMSLSSSPYPKGVDEFIKSGLTPIDSDLVKPARVAESPVQMECKVLEVKELGSEGAAGNLVICEVVCMHLREDLITEDNHLDQERIDMVARMGGSWYCRAHGDAIFQLKKPISSLGIGVDQLPDKIRNCPDLSGNELGKLGSLTELPDLVSSKNQLDKVSKEKITLNNAKALLAQGDWEMAYLFLMHCL